ncbi:hypothetical protein [Runella salmonicolor]|uniref:Uncharacterized protein n=1 Tax=Runella salmonicolor TaxID=2950278 RepID=A0ABT1FJM0_9BACT|nr:hypothetical protein [Runella salmonicolor]MCP1381912.1 hypothetical protein [Runella salmonicolor]
MNHSNDTYQLTIDPTPQQTKPNKGNKAIGKISNQLNLVTGLTINELSTYVSQPFGYTWTGGIFNGSPTKDNWTQQSVFGLDFDNTNQTISIDEVLERFKKLDLFPNLWYTTFSDSEKIRKFRVLIFVDKPVIDKEFSQLIINGLKSLFPEADSACFSLSRFFFGGIQSHILSEIPTSTLKLIDVLSIQLIAEDGGRVRKLMGSFPRCSSNNNDDFGKKWGFLYNNYTNPQNLPDLTQITTQEGQEQIELDFDIAAERIKILKEFLKGKWLYHDELFGLATNLLQVKGGRKLMRETMEKYNESGCTQYTQNNFTLFTYLNKVNYPPIPIHRFSPYPEDRDIHDLISAAKDQRGKIELLEPIHKISLQEAEQAMRSEFNRVLETGEKGKIYLFKLPTAIGKTQLLTGSMNVTIAAPTNDLKTEISERMTVEHVISPKMVEFENDFLNRKLQYYYSIGLPKKSTALLHDIVDGEGYYGLNAADKALAATYLTQLENAVQSEQTVLTTHAQALHAKFRHDTIIFDEDPLNALITVKQLNISDLFKLKLMVQGKTTDLANIISLLESAIPSEIRESPVLTINIDELVDKAVNTVLDSNIFDFFAGSYFMKDAVNKDLIHYVLKKELSLKKKIIIMSATLPVPIYKKLWGDRIEIIDITDVTPMGSVIQHTKRSCSRNALNRYAKDISREVENTPVITFKNFQSYFQHPVNEMYFGNCAGYDKLAGQDIVVVGTPHRDNIQYLLTAKVLGVDFKTKDTTMTFQKIEYNGFKFKFNCYDNEDLRNIQLSLIESDLIQAVGRARTLRTNAKVVLYSNYPLRISDKFIY